MRGAEADHVIAIGTPGLEEISRARLSLSIISCCQTEDRKWIYNNNNKYFRAAADEGRVLVATPPWHPQVQ